MKTDPLKILTTADGSNTLANNRLEEIYHSQYGAITESRHVYIANGLNYLLHQNDFKEISIFEMGFGTGLNVLLTAIQRPKSCKIFYQSIDNYPIPPGLPESLNYGKLLKSESLFKKIHSIPWNNTSTIFPGFNLLKIRGNLLDFSMDRHYQLIYYDAFAPSKQPELWTKQVLEKCIHYLLPGGCFVTYSAQGKLRRILQSLKLKVETPEGPPGKRHITRAIK